MGLFIGASLLTILEILDYLCEVGLGPSWGRERTLATRAQGEGLHGHLPLLLVLRCSGTGSWGISGTEGAPKGTPAPLW